MGAEPRIQQNYILPVTDGVTYAYSNIGTSSAQVVAAAPQRKSIMFHNPNQQSNKNLIVCPASDANGAALSATFAAPAGGLIIFPGMSVTITGDAASGAWKAAADDTSQSITIITSSQRP